MVRETDVWSEGGRVGLKLHGARTTVHPMRWGTMACPCRGRGPSAELILDRELFGAFTRRRVTGDLEVSAGCLDQKCHGGL